MRLTDEQEAIIDEFVVGGTLRVIAVAGSGKTTTLRECARATADRRILYLAYNAVTAKDARTSFPRNTNCSTAHALARAAVGIPYWHRIPYPIQWARQQAEILGIRGHFRVSRDRVLDPAKVAKIAMMAVDRFCLSADPVLAAKHFRLQPGLEEPELHEAVVELAMPYASAAWADITNVNGQLKWDFEYAVKLWQLSDPRLPYDTVFFDEAQDAWEAIAWVVRRQTDMQRVVVGDPNQALYGWRGAIDAMGTFPGAAMTLTRSFRFGPRIAEQANLWLQLLGADVRVVGYDAMDSHVGPLNGPADAVLCRTNAQAIVRVMDALDNHRPVAMAGGTDGIMGLARAAKALMQGRPTDHAELFVFQSWQQLEEYVREEEEAAGQLRVFVDLVNEWGPDELMGAMRRLSPEDQPGVLTVSTAHGAKGREWNAVEIADDHHEPTGIERLLEPPPIGPPDKHLKALRAECMVAYVATTRARERLFRGDPRGLSWIDHWKPLLVPQHARGAA